MRLRALETSSGTVLVFDRVTHAEIASFREADFSALPERGYTALAFTEDVDLTDDRG